MKSEKYPLSFVTHIFRNGYPGHDGDRNCHKLVKQNMTIFFIENVNVV